MGSYTLFVAAVFGGFALGLLTGCIFARIPPEAES
jgi:hypothetical protein